MPRARIPRSSFKPPKQKRPGDSRQHLSNVKRLPCVVCDCIGVHAHHLLRVGDQLPKGMSRKNEDRWAIPLCPRHHNGQRDSAHGHGNDEAWLASKGIDGRALANALWAKRDDFEAMQRIVFRFHQRRTLGDG